MKGAVYNNGLLAGYIGKAPDGSYTFSYTDDYYYSKQYPPISLTLPKNQQTYHSANLFAFFHGLLSEGFNKDIQCRILKIDDNDHFARLLQTAGDDTIGAITIKPVEDEM